jgi:MFS transporter, PHS family, inorganic phosphate transporter
MLGFVYWNSDVHSDHETAINSATLAGCIVGQIIFGALADHWGRRKMYGFELIILAVGTFGFVMASAGYNGSMNIVSWLIFWRFISGIGIGAGYPLSAVITSEFAPKEKRARLLATVFFMQAMGQLFATLVSLAVIAGYRNDSLSHTGDEAKATIDSVWRWVMGAALLPTLVAIIARFKIPESPRYTMDVLGNTFKASVDARDYRRQARDEQELQPMMNGNANANGANPAPVYIKASYADAVNYFVTQGNWVYLLGTTVSWFVLDFGKCDLSHNSFHIYLSSLLVNTHSNHHAS